MADNNGLKLPLCLFNFLIIFANSVTIGRQTEIYRFVTEGNVLQIRHGAIVAAVNTAVEHENKRYKYMHKYKYKYR